MRGTLLLFVVVAELPKQQRLATSSKNGPKIAGLNNSYPTPSPFE